MDIRRIGDEPGSPHVKFGELFDDDDVQQYYEALVGTLKSAKKRGMIDFKGQMLLKGVHDNVIINITDSGLRNEVVPESPISKITEEAKDEITPGPEAPSIPSAPVTPEAPAAIIDESADEDKVITEKAKDETTLEPETPSIPSAPVTPEAPATPFDEPEDEDKESDNDHDGVESG